MDAAQPFVDKADASLDPGEAAPIAGPCAPPNPAIYKWPVPGGLTTERHSGGRNSERVRRMRRSTTDTGAIAGTRADGG